MRRLHKYLALTPAGRMLFLHSLLLLPLVMALLRSRGMARTTAVLARMKYRAGRAPDALAPCEIARLVHAAASILRAGCLSRSLVLSHFLRCRGIPVEIRLGVSRQADGKLAAHAWVELDGLPLNDSLDVSERYAALSSCATRLRADYT